jgi:hypothetical protein
MRLSVTILSIAALLCLSTQARADLVGDTINYGEYNGASNADFAFSLGSITVPGFNDNFGFTTTITGNTITIAEDESNSTTCNTLPAGTPGLVCGLVFTDATKDPGFASISLDPSSTTNKLTPSISGGNVYLDFTNLTLDFGDVATFDLTFGPAAVPEPGSLLLLSTGVLGLAGTLRKRMFSR